MRIWTLFDWNTCVEQGRMRGSLPSLYLPLGLIHFSPKISNDIQVNKSTGEDGWQGGERKHTELHTAEISASNTLLFPLYPHYFVRNPANSAP
jgi:hypothetical protein